jgi:hypothetical protein
VTQPDPSSPEDYGYDLAHEETGRPASAADPGTPREQGSAPPAAGQGEGSEDLGYDEAHDF